MIIVGQKKHTLIDWSNIEYLKIVTELNGFSEIYLIQAFLKNNGSDVCRSTTLGTYTTLLVAEKAMEEIENDLWVDGSIFHCIKEDREDETE